MYCEEVKGYKAKRFHIGNGFFVEIVQADNAESEIWIGRYRFGQALYLETHSRLIDRIEDGELDVEALINMDSVLELVRKRLSYPDERWVIDGSGVIAGLLADDE